MPFCVAWDNSAFDGLKMATIYESMVKWEYRGTSGV